MVFAKQMEFQKPTRENVIQSFKEEKQRFKKVKKKVSKKIKESPSFSLKGFKARRERFRNI